MLGRLARDRTSVLDTLSCQDMPRIRQMLLRCLFVGWLTSQQQASVSQGRICSDNFTCCHTEIEVADPTFYLTQSQYTDTGPTSPSADPITPGAWQGSHWSANFEVTGMTRPRKNPGASGIRTRDLPLSRRKPSQVEGIESFLLSGICGPLLAAVHPCTDNTGIVHDHLGLHCQFGVGPHP